MKIAFDARYLNAKTSGVGTYCRNVVQAMIDDAQELEFLFITRKHGITHDFPGAHAEEAWFPAPPRSEMAGALRRLGEDSQLRARLVERGSARAAEFTWKRCAQTTLGVYEKVLSEGRRAAS